MSQEKSISLPKSKEKVEIPSSRRSALRAALGRPKSQQLQQLYDEAIKLEEEEKYLEALANVRKILGQEKKESSLPALLSRTKINLMIWLNQSYMSTLSSRVPEKILKECKAISRLIEESTAIETEELEANVNLYECDSTLYQILSLLKLVMERNLSINPNVFLLLISCRLGFILKLFKGKDRLEKLHALSPLMSSLSFNIILERAENERTAKNDKVCSIFDKILVELKKIKEVGREAVAEKQAWCSYHYGTFVGGVKARSVFSEAIKLMTNTFGANAVACRVTGYLHKGLIFTLNDSIAQPALKVNLWKEVIAMLEQATDWESTDERCQRLKEAFYWLKICSEKLDN